MEMEKNTRRKRNYIKIAWIAFIAIILPIIWMLYTEGQKEEQKLEKIRQKTRLESLIKERQEKEELNMTVEKLPKEYDGHSLTRVISDFKIPPKNEFETSEEYRNRVRAQQIPNFIYAFSKSVSNMAYDADSKLISFPDFSLGFYIRTGSGDKTYIYENFYKLHFVEKVVNKQPKIKMESEKAKFFKDHVAKGDIQLLYVCKIKRKNDISPIVLTESGYSEPTASFRYKHSRTTESLSVELIELWIYNFRTGEIYLKQKSS